MAITNSRDWRSDFDSRHKIVDDIVQDYYSNLNNVLQFEEHLYNASISKSDYLEKVSSQILLPVRSVDGYNQNPVLNSIRWQRQVVTPEISKSPNEYGSTGSIMEEEIIGFLKRNPPMTTVDLVHKFKPRPKTPQDRIIFTKILKKNSTIINMDGSKVVVLRDEYLK